MKHTRKNPLKLAGLTLALIALALGLATSHVAGYHKTTARKANSHLERI